MGNSNSVPSFQRAKSVVTILLNKQTTKTEQADKHTRKETIKNNDRKQRKQHKWKHSECDHVKKGRKKQRRRILQAYENKISYTFEDGHVGRNM
jgi:hypothetical protein